jgi:hypothetical protein
LDCKGLMVGKSMYYVISRNLSYVIRHIVSVLVPLIIILAHNK